MAQYANNYANGGRANGARAPSSAATSRAQPHPSRVKKDHSVLPHLGRVLTFERTPMEAWHEYQDEITSDVSQRHAILIQARARGMLERKLTERMKLQNEKILVIQKHVRSRLARKTLKRIKTQYKVLTLFANAERKAVMKLELAYLKRRERRREASASIVRAHYVGRKARQKRDDMLMQRQLVMMMAKGEAKAALRIQYAYWRYRVAVLNSRKEAEQATAVLRAKLAEEEKAKAALRRHEDAVLAKPVGKRMRKSPLVRFQSKHLELDAVNRSLTYWKLPVAPAAGAGGSQPAKAKQILLDSVIKIEQQSTPAHLLLVYVGVTLSVPNAKRTMYTLQLADREAADIWLKRLRPFCRNAHISAMAPP